MYRIRCGQAQKRGKRGRCSELINDVGRFLLNVMISARNEKLSKLEMV